VLGTISARQKLATPIFGSTAPLLSVLMTLLLAFTGFIALKSLCNVYASEIVIIVTCLGVRAGDIVVACNDNDNVPSVSVCQL